MANGQFKNLTNEQYWEQRSLHKARNTWKDESKVEKVLAKAYQATLVDIKKEVADLFAKYGTDGLLEYSSLTRNLSIGEMREYQLAVDSIYKRYINSGDEQLLTELAKLRDLKEISILQAKVNQIEAQLYELGHMEQQTIEESLNKTYEDIYYHTIFELQVGIGVGFTFNKLNSRAVREAISFPWSGDMFSDLIWDNKKLLIKNLRKTMTNGIIRGQSYQKMARDLNNSVLGGNGYKASLRVVRTETAHVINSASTKGYKESGLVRQYVYIATLDSRTSKICQDLDGEVFNLDDYQQGVNAPVMHPNCRSTTAPYFDESDLENATRIARDPDTDGNYKILAKMTYNDWFSTYVK